jgi:rubrerythrin
LEEKIRQLERQSSYERLARLELSVENERLRAASRELVACWSCPDCAFTFDAMHEDAEGGYSCPACAEIRLTAERDKLRAELSDLYPAIESLRDELKRAKALLAEAAS